MSLLLLLLLFTPQTFEVLFMKSSMLLSRWTDFVITGVVVLFHKAKARPFLVEVLTRLLHRWTRHPGCSISSCLKQTQSNYQLFSWIAQKKGKLSQNVTTLDPKPKITDFTVTRQRWEDLTNATQSFSPFISSLIILVLNQISRNYSSSFLSEQLWNCKRILTSTTPKVAAFEHTWQKHTVPGPGDVWWPSIQMQKPESQNWHVLLQRRGSRVPRFRSASGIGLPILMAKLNVQHCL